MMEVFVEEPLALPGSAEKKEEKKEKFNNTKSRKCIKV